MENLKTIDSISNEFKNNATKIWNDWAKNGSHPISKMMAEDRFLNNLVPNVLTSVDAEIPVNTEKNFSEMSME